LAGIHPSHLILVSLRHKQINHGSARSLSENDKKKKVAIKGRRTVVAISVKEATPFQWLGLNEEGTLKRSLPDGFKFPFPYFTVKQSASLEIF
jgi:hypothetical protein